jgi:hypothetical protein
MSTASDSSEYGPKPQPQAQNLGPVKISQSIHRIYKAFLKHPDLSPSPEINATFSELVDLCIQPHDVECVAAILNDKRVAKLSAHLRSICSTGEFKLESYWADKIVKGNSQSESKSTQSKLLPLYHNSHADQPQLRSSYFPFLIIITTLISLVSRSPLSPRPTPNPSNLCASSVPARCR